MTSQERTAVISLLVAALVGHGIRLYALDGSDAAGGFTLRSSVAAPSLAEQRARAAKAARPLGRAERIDLNRAGAADLARLPKVGIPLAKAIIKQRAVRGGFASMAEVDAVPGIGPGLLVGIAPHVTLGDTDRVRTARAVEPAPVQAPLVVVGSPKKGRNRGAAALPVGPIRLNSATQAELETLPGIGPGRAKRILAYRQTYGPFASAMDLGKVPGIPPALVTQLVPQVVVP